MSTAIAGLMAWIARVAAMPSITGISRSIRTTSGRRCPAKLDRLDAVRGHPDELHVRLRGDHTPEAVTEHSVVVDDQHAGHRLGTSSSTVVPSPVAERTVNSAPDCRASSSSSDSPRWPSPTALRSAVPA